MSDGVTVTSSENQDEAQIRELNRVPPGVEFSRDLKRRPAIGGCLEYPRGRCESCPLHDESKVAYSYLGRPPREGEKRIVVVGEAPGREETIYGIPFVGASGKLLRSLLESGGVDTAPILFTNTCQCRPPDGRNPSGPSHLEIDACWANLYREIVGFRPDIIFPVGATSSRVILGDMRLSILKERGKWFYSERWECWVLPTIHPAAVLRNMGLFTDFALDVEKLIRGPMTFDEPVTSIADCTGSALKMISILGDPRRFPTPYRSIDIETTSLNPLEGEILCIGISPNDRQSFIFPEEILANELVKKRLQEIFDNPQLRWVAHNGIAFDIPYMKHQLNLRCPLYMDTMLCHYTLDERPGSHGLKKLASQYFDAPDYDRELRGYLIDESVTFRAVPRPLLHKYLGYDTTVTFKLIEPLLKEMKDDDTYRLYFDYLHSWAEALSEVQLNGTMIDVPYLTSLGEEWTAEYERIQNEIREQIGWEDLSLSSHVQVPYLLFEELGLPSLKETPTGKPSTDGEVLESLKKYDTTGIVEKLLLARQYRKMTSTYVEGIIKRVEKDGRIRCDYLLHGTATGRLSSRDPNLQNIPKLFGPQVRKAFIATPGWKLMEADYSQLELRVAAWYAYDKRMIEQFASGEDIHRQVAAAMYHIEPEEVTSLQRYLAKYVDFGILYGRGAPAIADQLQCSVAEGQALLDGFLNQYVELREWMKSVQEQAKKKGHTLTPNGRKRRYPFVTNDNKGDIERQSVNTHCQALASDICLDALCRIHRWADPNKLRVLLTVHDSILMEVREDSLDLSEEVRKIMQSPWVEDRGVPWVVDIKIGDSWGEMSEDFNTGGQTFHGMLS